MTPLRVIDSHTEGEPTRVLIEGGPDLGEGLLRQPPGTLARRVEPLRRALIDPPRGSEALVGVIPCRPITPGCAAGLVFVNNVGVLPMCGHATLGFAVTLARIGRLDRDEHRFETAAGVVTVRLHDDTTAELDGVRSYRHASGVVVDVPGLGPVRGDIAWGGNWFFLVEPPPLPLDPTRLPALVAAARDIRDALDRTGIRAGGGAPIDHVALFGPAGRSGADASNLVLCPGGAHDRSPCGTGTSAWLACLAEDRRLPPGQTWVQDSVCGGRFLASYAPAKDRGVIPTLRGRAFVYGETTLSRNTADPLWAA